MSLYGTRLTAAALALIVVACGGSPELETRTFELESLQPHEVEGLIDPYVYRDRERAPGAASLTERSVTVRELPENLDRIEAVLEEYDAPEVSLRLHFQVIEADGFSGQDPAIAQVQAELEKLFRFDGYRLAASSVLQGLAYQEFRQQLGGEAAYTVAGEVLRVRRSGSSGSVALAVRLWRGPSETLFETSVNVPIGETVVLGSGRPRSEGPAAILVVTPEISG